MYRFTASHYRYHFSQHARDRRYDNDVINISRGYLEKSTGKIPPPGLDQSIKSVGPRKAAVFIYETIRSVQEIWKR